jgi:hypothetical protein
MLGALKDAGRKLKAALPKEKEPKGTRIHYGDNPIPDWLTENTDESALKYGGQFRELVPNPEYEGIERQAFGQGPPQALTGTGYASAGSNLREGVARDLNTSPLEGLGIEGYYTDPKSGITYTRADTAKLKEKNILPKEALPDRPEVQEKNRELIARLLTERAMKERDIRLEDYFPDDQLTGKQMYDVVKKQALERIKKAPYELVKEKTSQFPDQQFFNNRSKLD